MDRRQGRQILLKDPSGNVVELFDSRANGLRPAARAAAAW
jgi:hypothetical protein